MAVGHLLLDSLLHGHWVRSKTLEDIHHQRVLFRKQAKQKMLGAHMFVMSALGFFPRLYQGTTYPAGEVVTAQIPLLLDDLRFCRRVIIARMNLTHRETDALEALADPSAIELRGGAATG